MATTKKSNHVKGIIPTPTPTGKETITVFESLAIATTDIDLADVIQFAILPAGCVPVGFIVGATDMDTGTAILAADFGLLNAGETAISAAAADGGAKWLTALALSGTAAITLHTSTKAIYDILKAVTPSSVDRIVAFVISTAATTAAAGTLTVEFSYKAAN
ncbi:MAG: hypothetical protein Q7T25_01175 [Sideroxyarcus sp.]|nr:hypothetical protein [Sideroxyarcus sp.]